MDPNPWAEKYDEHDETVRRRDVERELYLQDLRDLLALGSGAGRRVVKAWLGRLGLFGLVWRRGVDIQNTSSRHDAALEIYRDLCLADRAAAGELFSLALAEDRPAGSGR
jgi:hypothetical protein